MQENLTATLDLIIRWEGSDVNRSAREPGGISKYGISLTAYSDYCKKFKLAVPTTEDVANLTEDFARNFYGQHWLPQIRFNDLPKGLDIRMGDISVNSGIGGATRLLQVAFLQFPLLNNISDDLIKTINKYTPSEAIHMLSAAWIGYKLASPSWLDIGDGTHRGAGHGWSNRNIDVTTQALKGI